MEESVGVGVKRLHASGDEIWRSVQPAIRIVNHQIPDTLSLNQTLTIRLVHHNLCNANTTFRGFVSTVILARETEIVH